MHSWTREVMLAALLLLGCGQSGDGARHRPSADPNSPGSNAGAGSIAGGGASSGGATSVNPTTCVQGVPQTSQLPRLNNAQYDNTIRDLFGISVQPSSALAPDTPGSVDKRAWDGYQAAAAAVATQVMADATARARFITCTPTGDGTACAQQVVTEFGQRAFRRPLTAAEIARFQVLIGKRAQITANNTFQELAQVLLQAFLVSPSFLTRAEIAEPPPQGSLIPLSAYEVATRLSYTLWASTPDAALLSAAAADQLSTPALILAQAQRMLQDPRAHAMVAEFHRAYAHMGPGTRWADFSRDATVYPAFSAAMVPAMAAETERFFDLVSFDMGGTFQDLMTKPVGFVNATLAPLYGLDPSKYGPDLVRVDLDPATRAGIFTRVGFLAAYSLANRSSPILRGAFLQKQVLCRQIGSPPADATSTPLPIAGLATNRARTDAQTSGSICVNCHHTLINPTGFALEAYDAVGALQTTEKDNGALIDTSSAVPIGDNTVNVKGPVELFQAIAKSSEGQRCYAQRWVEHAYERPINPQDSCTVDKMAIKLSAGGYTVLNLITDLTQSDSFRFRAVPAEVAP